MDECRRILILEGLVDIIKGRSVNRQIKVNIVFILIGAKVANLHWYLAGGHIVLNRPVLDCDLHMVQGGLLDRVEEGTINWKLSAEAIKKKVKQ